MEGVPLSVDADDRPIRVIVHHANRSVGSIFEKLASGDGTMSGIGSFQQSTSHTQAEDCHSCGQCGQSFSDIEEFIQHRLTHQDNRLPFDKHKTSAVSSLVREASVPKVVDSHPVKDDNRRPGRPRKGHNKFASNPMAETGTDGNDTVLYICSYCRENLSTQAAFKEHLLHSHCVIAADSDGDNTTLPVVSVSNIKNLKDALIDSAVDGPVGNTDGNDRHNHSDEPGSDDQWNAGKSNGNTSPITVSISLPGEIPGNGSDLICELCSKKFKDVGTLNRHKMTHNANRPFKCTYDGCSYSFKTKGSLVRHVRRHTDERPFECPRCNRSFRESGGLSRHLRSRISCIHKTDGDLPRYRKKWQHSTDAFFSRGSEGEVNMLRSQSEMGGNPCDASGQKDGLVSADDVTINRDLAPTQCMVCLAPFSEMCELVNHLRAHLPRLHWQCIYCHKMLESRDKLISHHQVSHPGLDRHVAIPTDEGELTGDDAGLHQKELNVTTPTTTGTHETISVTVGAGAGLGGSINAIRIVSRLSTTDTESIEEEHKNQLIAVKQLLFLEDILPNGVQGDGTPGDGRSEGKRRRVCPVCSRVFRGTSYLRLHIRTHTGERPFSCDHCPKRFTSKDGYNKHAMSHSDSRQFKCGECEKLFKRISHLKEHMKIHTNERPYPCPKCMKTFKTSNAWKVHMRTHSDYMEWRCKVCKRQFREKGALLRHSRTHTGEKPYPCKYCGREFAEHGTLNRHLRAKVPCTTKLAIARTQKEFRFPVEPGLDEVTVVKQTSGGDEGETAAATVQPTDTANVLAQFSSVVANTQQYIQCAEGQDLDQCIVVESSSVPMETVEVITDQEVEGNMSTYYIV